MICETQYLIYICLQWAYISSSTCKVFAPHYLPSKRSLFNHHDKIKIMHYTPVLQVYLGSTCSTYQPVPRRHLSHYNTCSCVNPQDSSTIRLEIREDLYPRLARSTAGWYTSAADGKQGLINNSTKNTIKISPTEAESVETSTNHEAVRNI